MRTIAAVSSGFKLIVRSLLKARYQPIVKIKMKGYGDLVGHIQTILVNR